MAAGGSSRVPISMLLQDKSSRTTEDDEEPKKKSREDWRKAKELEEARKAGTAPAAVDEEGRDINPHIPQYISSAPWYYNTAGPTLKHQRPQEESRELSGIDEWYKRGVDTSKSVTKFRKGACENCGAVTHKKKDCMERPRKVGAKFNGGKIAYDEFVQPKIVSDYDGKRDRWAGYDPANHREIVEEYQKIEVAKRELRAQKLKENPDLADEEEDAEDEDKYVDEVDMPGTKVDSKQRITVRNLRIREDTAKYLRNLDPNSAYYDPKTRSMRDNPNPNLHPEETDFAGENFVRYSGDIQKHAQAQLFAWEAHGKGVDVHVLAEPTKLELLQQEYEKKKDQFKDASKNKVVEQYGGEEHLQVPPRALLLAQTENYVEYSRFGKIIKGEDKPIIRSRYEEDVFVNNHTTVWGSFWRDGVWGYKCCESTIKNSYCVGENGKSEPSDQVAGPSRVASDYRATPSAPEPSAVAKQPDPQQTVIAAAVDSSSSSSSDSDSDSDSDSEEERKAKKKAKKLRKKKKKRKRKEEQKRRKRAEAEEQDKLKVALRQEERNQARAEQLLKMDERKRPYNSMFEVREPTQEEMEAFQMKRCREDDPMRQFMDK
ncbi:pre-mRNA-splicing factor Slu7 [Culex quinquefasciatus]|uniref:pre-mRNA-splicing factor Slu7 n=1 Tax=Culex quinquefasciatus TaxID=7176 RepID=UPI0018E33105|nr:pre-mRNA-splicing factor Slu7 [Culex quinquefasciatus]